MGGCGRGSAPAAGDAVGEVRAGRSPRFHRRAATTSSVTAGRCPRMSFPLLRRGLAKNLFFGFENSAACQSSQVCRASCEAERVGPHRQLQSHGSRSWPRQVPALFPSPSRPPFFSGQPLSPLISPPYPPPARLLSFRLLSTSFPLGLLPIGLPSPAWPPSWPASSFPPPPPSAAPLPPRLGFSSPLFPPLTVHTPPPRVPPRNHRPPPMPPPSTPPHHGCGPV